MFFFSVLLRRYHTLWVKNNTFYYLFIIICFEKNQTNKLKINKKNILHTIIPQNFQSHTFTNPTICFHLCSLLRRLSSASHFACEDRFELTSYELAILSEYGAENGYLIWLCKNEKQAKPTSTITKTRKNALSCVMHGIEQVKFQQKETQESSRWWTLSRMKLFICTTRHSPKAEPSNSCQELHRFHAL